MLTKACEQHADSNNYIKDYKGIYISYASSISEKIEQDKFLLASNRITKYDTPIQKNPKDGPIEYHNEECYVLDWTTRMYEGASGKSFKDSNNNHAKLIKQNTADFEVWARENNRIEE